MVVRFSMCACMIYVGLCTMKRIKYITIFTGIGRRGPRHVPGGLMAVTEPETNLPLP